MTEQQITTDCQKGRRFIEFQPPLDEVGKLRLHEAAIDGIFNFVDDFEYHGKTSSGIELQQVSEEELAEVAHDIACALRGAGYLVIEGEKLQQAPEQIQRAQRFGSFFRRLPKTA